MLDALLVFDESWKSRQRCLGTDERVFSGSDSDAVGA